MDYLKITIGIIPTYVRIRECYLLAVAFLFLRISKWLQGLLRWLSLLCQPSSGDAYFAVSSDGGDSFQKEMKLSNNAKKGFSRDGEYKLSFTLTNISDSVFHGGLYASVIQLTHGKYFSQPEIVNSTDHLSGLGAVIDLREQMKDAKLLPGEATLPFQVCIKCNPAESYENIWKLIKKREQSTR